MKDKVINWLLWTTYMNLAAAVIFSGFNFYKMYHLEINSYMWCYRYEHTMIYGIVWIACSHIPLIIASLINGTNYKV